MTSARLKGLRVLNTRPQGQGERLNLAIQQAGGIAIACPALSIEPVDSSWLLSLPPLNDVKKAIFISANAVHYCFKTLQEARIDWPKSIKVMAIGQATAQRLQDFSIRVDAIPGIADSEHLLSHPLLQQVENEQILLFKGEGGRTLIGDTLLKRSARVTAIAVYRRRLPKIDPKVLQSLWRNDDVDIILFTSHQTMTQLFILFGDEAKTWLCSKPCLVLSQRLADAAAEEGFQTIIVSHPEGIMDALHQFTQGINHGQ